MFGAVATLEFTTLQGAPITVYSNAHSPNSLLGIIAFCLQFGHCLITSRLSGTTSIGWKEQYLQLWLCPGFILVLSILLVLSEKYLEPLQEQT